jgi:hypothetical protein
MNPLVCSLCGEVMSEENTKEFGIEVPEIGKKLTFRACVFCQERAESNNLHICLRCKSISWYPSGNPCASGVQYFVKFQCNRCATKAAMDDVVRMGAPI